MSLEHYWYKGEITNTAHSKVTAKKNDRHLVFENIPDLEFFKAKILWPVLGSQLWIDLLIFPFTEACVAKAY
jgi:hypothetical protein